MKLLFKKLLVNILVLMVVMLPLRNVLAMPMQVSMDHCAVAQVDTSMNMMNHAGHKMPMSDLADTKQEQKKLACACCQQCDGDCTGCVHISSAIIFGFSALSNLTIIEVASVVTDSLLTRSISPPSRPPLAL